MTAPVEPPRLRGPVVIYGTGLIGASIGLALADRGIPVLLSDPSPSALAVAVDIGAGSPLSEDPGLSPELVVVAAPPDVCARVVADAMKRFPAAIVTDVSSVKGAILAELEILAGRSRDEGRVLDLSRYLGSHPMAGRERSGAVSARGELFQAMPWVICPHYSDFGASSLMARSIVENLALDLGALIHDMEPERHDAAVALVSHVPQVLSSLLAARLQGAEAQALALAGNGLRDVTRIAASEAGMWVPILEANAHRISAVLHELHEDLIRLLGALDRPDAQGSRLHMAKVISTGNAGVSRIPGKHGGPARSYAWISVLVDDEPGQVARLLTEIGETGINVEDLRLNHSSGRNVGMVELSVLPDVRERLVDELTLRDWKVVQ